MVDNLINTSFPALLLFTVFAFSVFVQLIYLWLVFNKVGLKRNLILPDERRGNPEPVSVVICAHNEFLHLRDNLPSILHQDYPEYEVLVVNHFSDDDTPYLLRKLQEQYPHLHVVTIEEELNFFTGKKFPLSIGIKSARYDRILLTDADCRPVSDQWIRWMSSGFDQRKEIVLGYGRYRYNKGLLNALIRFDTLHIALQYLGFALAGRPYMGIGRNLAYSKGLFFRNNGFISHYRIRSGDDDLFVNRVAVGSNTAVILHESSFTESEPKRTFGKWITQKRRHLSTATWYRPAHRFLLGFYVLTSILFYLTGITLLSLVWSLFPVLALFMVRIASQFIVFYLSMRRLGERDLLPFLPVMELTLIVLNGSMALANLWKKPVKWR